MRDASLDEFTDPAPSDGDPDGNEADPAERDGATEEEGGGEASASREVQETDAEPDFDDSAGPGADYGSGSDDDPAADDATVDGAATDAGTADVAAPASVTPTYEFAPDGADCEDCGETVRRRWRGGDGMVCPDCKEW